MSEKRDSNSRPQPWQGCALPAELFPLRQCGVYSTDTTDKVNSFCAAIGLFAEKMFSVMFQLIDRLSNICQGLVRAGLFEAIRYFRLPALCQFF